MAEEECKIYVGNLPFKYSDKDLEDLFKKFKPLSAQVIMDRETGRSRGFGFVTFNSQDDVKDACDEMNGYDVDERNLKVSKANSRGSGGGGGGYRRGGGGGYRSGGGGGYSDRRYDSGGGGGGYRRGGGGGGYRSGGGGGYGGSSYSSGGSESYNSYNSGDQRDW